MNVECFVCHKKFKKYHNYNVKRHFCSRQCWSKHCSENLKKWRNGDLTAMRNKNPEFRKKVSDGLKKYFSKNPRRNEKWYIDRWGIDYVPNKLKHSSYWKRLSLELRSLYPCHRCGTTIPILDVHHIIPFAISKDNSLVNLVVLCRPCHKLTEDNNLKIFSIVGDWEVVRILYRLKFEDVGRPLRYKLCKN